MNVKLASHASEKRSIGLIQPFYNLSTTPYTGNRRRKHIFVLTILSVSLVWTYHVFGFLQ